MKAAALAVTVLASSLAFATGTAHAQTRLCAPGRAETIVWQTIHAGTSPGGARWSVWLSPNSIGGFGWIRARVTPVHGVQWTITSAFREQSVTGRRVQTKNSYGNTTTFTYDGNSYGTSQGRHTWIDFSISSYSDLAIPWFRLEIQKKTSRCQAGSTVYYRDWGRF